MRWTIARDQQFLWDDYGSDVLLFDSVSGSTHLLNPSAAEALEFLGGRPEGVAAEGIHSHLLSTLGIAEADLPLPFVDEMLEHLEAIGLLARAPEHAPR